jgi:hypothetical protein
MIWNAVHASIKIIIITLSCVSILITVVAQMISWRVPPENELYGAYVNDRPYGREELELYEDGTVRQWIRLNSGREFKYNGTWTIKDVSCGYGANIRFNDISEIEGVDGYLLPFLHMDKVSVCWGVRKNVFGIFITYGSDENFYIKK